MPHVAKSYNEDLLSAENVKKFVLPYYNLEDADISQIKFKDTDKQRAVYKVTLLDKSYCLKKVYFPINELLFVYSSVEWLFRNGINVPRFLPTKDHGRYVNYNDMLFILTPWINGSKCDYDNVQNILDCSTELARFHNSTVNFIPINGSYTRTGYENLYLSFIKHLQQLLNCSNLAFRYNDKFSKLFLQNFDTNLSLARKSVEISSTINDSCLSKSLCHLDFVNKNIIFDEKNTLWVIDFDKCKMDYCIHDISYFLRRLLKRNSTKWDTELAINILRLYEEVHPLTLDEYKSILVYLSFPQKYWKISRDYYNNIKKCNQSSFISLLENSMERLNYHVQFIDNFQTYIEDKFGTKIV